jgi:hypothetical protein
MCEPSPASRSHLHPPPPTLHWIPPPAPSPPSVNLPAGQANQEMALLGGITEGEWSSVRPAALSSPQYASSPLYITAFALYYSAEVAIARAIVITASFSTDSTNHGLFAYMNFINAPIRAIAPPSSTPPWQNYLQEMLQRTLQLSMASHCFQCHVAEST